MYRLHGFFTQNTLKTVYVLEELGVDYDFRFVNLQEGEHKTPEFTAMNPMTKVPVLQHDGRYLWESGAIVRYLANVEDSPLYPADAFARAQVDQWIDFFTCHLGRQLTTVFFQRIIKPMAGFGDPDEAACEEALGFATQQAAAVDAWLAERRWLTGAELSIADLFAFAYVEQSAQIDFPLADYAHLSAWFERLEARPAIARARAKVHP